MCVAHYQVSAQWQCGVAHRYRLPAQESNCNTSAPHRRTRVNKALAVDLKPARGHSYSLLASYCDFHHASVGIIPPPNQRNVPRPEIILIGVAQGFRMRCAFIAEWPGVRYWGEGGLEFP